VNVAARTLYMVENDDALLFCVRDSTSGTPTA
jgi:hypothetical protein